MRLERGEYIYDLDFYPTAIDYTYLGKTYNLQTGYLRAIGKSRHPKGTKEWFNDMCDSLLDNFKGTDMKHLERVRF